VNKKRGYSNHPETIRWIGHLWALKKRHQLLVAEMSLRGFSDKSPVVIRDNEGVWPETYIDEPFQQFQILKSKYKNKEQGRIPLPKNAQELWSQHKYSMLARDVALYKKLGRDVSAMKSGREFSELTKLLTEMLRRPPSFGGLRNVLQHMWGHVSGFSSAQRGKVESWSLSRLLEEIQRYALANREPYLTFSTALSELRAWIPYYESPSRVL
jgi:uncharacterized protein YbgA (DUF1722 family)